MEKVIYQNFKKLSFDNSHKVTSDLSLVNDFIKSCNNVSDIFLGESENIHSYPYKAVVYCQNIYNPVTHVLEFMYCGISGSTKEGKLLKRPTEDWYNPKIKYAGKKVEDIRKKLFLGEYYCETSITHELYGKDQETMQRCLNILEMHYISIIPEEQKLNTALGGGNYIKGRRIASPIFENENYIPDEEEKRNETSYWMVDKKDLIEFKYNDPGYYFADEDNNPRSSYRREKVRIREIKYKNLSDHGKKQVKDKYLTGIYYLDDSKEQRDCFVVDSKKKEELENIIKYLDRRSWYDHRSVACVYINYDKDNFIDFSKSSGYFTIKECYDESPENCYATVRNYVNEGCYGYHKTSDFIKKYLGLNFKI